MNQSLIVLSIIEGLYLVYMYIFFETTTVIHHPLERVLTQGVSFLKHPIGTTERSNQICMLGSIASILFLFWFVIRCLFTWNHVHVKKINTVFMTLLFFCSLLLNLNAFVYAIPVFLIEWYVSVFFP